MRDSTQHLTYCINRLIQCEWNSSNDLAFDRTCLFLLSSISSSIGCPRAIVVTCRLELSPFGILNGFDRRMPRRRDSSRNGVPAPHVVASRCDDCAIVYCYLHSLNGRSVTCHNRAPVGGSGENGRRSRITAVDALQTANAREPSVSSEQAIWQLLHESPHLCTNSEKYTSGIDFGRLQVVPSLSRMKRFGMLGVR